jgi:transposase-like protein
LIRETGWAKYWLSVLNELKNCRVENVLVSTVDAIKGISEAIEAVFPPAEVPKCIVHQIRNSLRYPGKNASLWLKTGSGSTRLQRNTKTFIFMNIG